MSASQSRRRLRRMPTLVAGCGLAVCLAAQTQAVVSQAGQAQVSQSAPQSPSSTPADNAMPMPLVAPLFIDNATTTSAITLVSDSSRPLDVDVMLSGPSGDQLAKTTVTIGAHAQRVVMLADLLAAAPYHPAAFGSVVVMPHRPSTMSAQLSIVSSETASTHDLEEEFLMMMGDEPAQYRAVATGASAVVLSMRSLSAVTRMVSVECLTAGGSRHSGAIALVPNQTLLVQACVDGGPRQMTSLEETADMRPDAKKGIGLSVSSAAPASELAVFGVGLQGEKSRRVRWAIPFADMNELRSPTAVYPVLPLGPGNVLASDSLGLRAAVANFGARPTEAVVMLSAGTGPGSQQKVIARITAPPHKVSVAELEDLPDDPTSGASMIIETDAAAGEVLSAIEAVSKSDGRWQHLALPRKDRNQADNGGQHPWRVDGGFASTLLLFNPDTQLSNSVRLSVYTDGGAPWTKLVTIAPMATVPVRLSDIINRQQPDDTGKTLPPGSTRGLVTWFTLAKPRIFGGLLQTDALSRIVRPYACGTTIALCDVSNSGTTIYSIGSVGEASADLSGCDSNGDCVCAELCGSAPALQGSTYLWEAYDPSVASLVSLPTDSTGQYQGQAWGGTESLVTVTDVNRCAIGPVTGMIVVAQPTLSCPSSVTRGQSASANITNLGSASAQWQFLEGGPTGTVTVTRSGGASWSGVMVTTGTVQATITPPSGSPLTLQCTITVNNRPNWAFAAVSATKQPNNYVCGDGTVISVPSPPSQAGDATGKYCLVQYYTFNPATVGDGGPNNGYSYVTSITNSQGASTTGYYWVISPDLENTTSSFYQAQCGNYNPATNTGFISGANLATNTIRHESDPAVQSHYAEYKTAQNAPSNNLGSVAEVQVAPPSGASAFVQNTKDILNARWTAILTATQMEPCGVNYDANCIFQGGTNFPPYQLPCQ